MNLKIDIITSISGQESLLAQEIVLFWSTQPTSDIRTRFGTSRPPSEKVFTDLFKNFAVLCLAYDTDIFPKRLVGHAEAGKLRNQAGWAEISVATDTEYRRLGIGTKLLQATIDACILQNIQGLKAYVLPHNKNIISLISHFSDQMKIVYLYRQGCGDIEYTISLI